MHTSQKAAIAEHRVIAQALEFGFTVSVPTTPARYDVVFEKGGEFLRPQVKYGGHAPNRSTGACRVSFNCWGGDGGKRSRTYQDDEIDLMLAFIPETEQIVELPRELYQGRQSVILRLVPSKNAQTKGINLVDDLVWSVSEQ